MAGWLAVLLLRGLRRIPISLALALMVPALYAYPLFRRAHARRLRAAFAASPFRERLGLSRYYRMRARLLLLGLKAHGGPLPRHRSEGTGHYQAALASGRPVVLIGLHAGPLEMLHRIPPAPAGKPFLILTAPAFAPTLTEYLATGREGEGKRILRTGAGGEKGLEQGLRAVLSQGGVLALMADQYPGPSGENEFLELWDRVQVPYPGRMLRFLARQDCAFIPVSAFLGIDGVTVFRFHPGMARPDASALRAFLEAAVAQAPEQWNWSYPKIFAVSPRNRAETLTVLAK